MTYFSSLNTGLGACFQPHSKIQTDLHLSQHKLCSTHQSKLLTLADFCPSFPSHGQYKQELIGKLFLQTIHPLAALSCPTPTGAVVCVSLPTTTLLLTLSVSTALPKALRHPEGRRVVSPECFSSFPVPLASFSPWPTSKTLIVVIFKPNPC